jgi:tetratricopeptide (TPR) repeat protein
MRIHFRWFKEANMRHSKILMACWIVVAVFLGSCDRSPEGKLAKYVKRGDEYVKEEKFREAAIEYKNAVKAVPKDPAAHWKLAKASLEAKDIRTAFTELRTTVELDPNNFEALGMLGEIYVMAGKKEEAAQIADNLVKSRPDDPQGYVLQSGIAVRAGKVDEGIAKLKKAAELDPKRVRTLLTIGNLHMLKRDRKGAQEWYDKALAVDPNSADVHMTRGNFFFATGERDEGEKEYRRAIDLSKEKEILRIALAEHYLHQGRMEDSEKELNAVIKEMDSQKARKVLAEIKLDSGKVADAKPIVEQILKENDRDLDGKYLKGRIALLEKRLDDAKALFGEVVKQDAGMARARLYNGLTDIQLGQIELGRKEIDEAVKLDPGNARAQLLLGEVSLRMGAPAAAEKAALEVLRRNPSNGKAAMLLADSFLARKEWKKGEQIYQAMIKQMPKNPAGYLKMGLSRKLQGKPKDAADFFAQAVERNLKDLTAINEYIFALAASGDMAKAGKVLDETVAREPENPLLWNMVGRFQLASGKPAEAEAAFLKSIELAPEYTTPYYQLGLLYAAQKKFPEAEARLAKVVEKNDKNVGAHVLLGMVLNSGGKIDAANKEYRKVLSLSPKHPIAANNLAANLADGGGNLDEALKFAQIAREAAPEESAVGDTLGWVYYRKGLIDTAYPLLADAAGKMKNNASIRYHHGMVLAKKGRNKEAAAELNAALSLDPAFPGADEARKILETLK